MGREEGEGGGEKRGREGGEERGLRGRKGGEERGRRGGDGGEERTEGEREVRREDGEGGKLGKVSAMGSGRGCWRRSEPRQARSRTPPSAT